MEQSPEEPDELECRRARGAFAAFLDGSVERPEQRRLRAHLKACPGCSAEFAAGISMTSSLARAARTEREREGRRNRRRQHRSLALSGAFARWTGGARGAHLRLLLVPAFAMLLMTRVGKGPVAADRVRVGVEQGLVHVSGEPLDELPEGRVIRRGEACSTGVGGRARLWSDDAEVVLGENTCLWVEHQVGPRLRLSAGQLEVTGTLILTTQRGVFECNAAEASVKFTPAGLALDVRRGNVRCFDSSGERTLSAGESLSLTWSQ